MGCWNKTCGLTQLPIVAGDPVVTFLIVESPSKYGQTHPCYSSAFWNLIPLPIYGEYDDYGWMEVDEGQTWKLNLFKKHLPINRVETEDDKSGFVRYESLQKKDMFSSFKAIGDAIHGGVYTYKYADKDLMISAMMIHRDTFNEMTSEINGEYSDSLVLKRDDALKMIDEYKIVHSESLKESNLLSKLSEDQLTDKSPEELQKILQAMARLIRFDDSNQIDEWVKSKFPDEKYVFSIPIHWIIRSWFSNRSMGGSTGYITSNFTRDVEKEDIPASELYDGFAFQYLIDSLRKQYFPQGHEGSQADIGKVNEKFAEAYQKRINDHKQAYGY